MAKTCLAKRWENYRHSQAKKMGSNNKNWKKRRDKGKGLNFCRRRWLNLLVKYFGRLRADKAQWVKCLATLKSQVEYIL